MRDKLMVAWLVIFCLLGVIDYVCHLSSGRFPTLTRSIVHHVPWWITMAFFSWAWAHFAYWYWKSWR